MKRRFGSSLWFMGLLAVLVAVAGCSGGGTGGDSTGGTGTTVVSGKVTLSSTVLGKPQLMRKVSEQARLQRFSMRGDDQLAPLPDLDALMKLNQPLFQTAMANASVDMYDADHPEWLYPVASGSTDSNGDYTLSSMTNASRNPGATYIDGSAIPAGNYTLVAYSGFGLGQKPTVAVQSIVKNFDGQIQNVNFEVLPSDVAPEVIYMFGVKKNTDGTERWGHSASGVNASIPANSAIQLSFSMPMWRDSLAAGITISPSLSGRWSLSADWLTATYYLNPNVQMVPGQVYTVTINGDDKDSAVPRALNVYGNALKTTAVGKFRAAAADTIGPTVQWNSPTVIEMGGTVDVTQSFRIESNKPLDVNGINLRGTPSIGVKPGVLFLGKGANGLYVYEFLLGEPLKLDTSYSLVVTGGRDLAGHAINNLTGSIRTKDAANTPGIDPAASAAIQNLQAQVKAVFGKWARSANDRNIAQWQSVMSGDFYLEYDVASRGIDSTWDLNRDGRYSLGEFSRQLVTYNFPQWEYCGSTITGIISPQAGTYINVVPLTETADFEFKLTASNQVNLSRCFDAAPRESLYMTLKFKNGAWKIVHGSIGIDTRDKSITKPNLINVKLEQDAFPQGSGGDDREITDGARMSRIPDNTNLWAKFSWEATQGVTTYIFVLSNERNPYNGFAIAFPSTVSAVSSDKDPISDLKGVDVSGKMGFDGYSEFTFQEGGKYYWEVIGLGTATAVPDPANPNNPNFVGNKSAKDVIRDISAVSKVRRFGIDGLFSELIVEVRAGSTGTNAPSPYNPAIFGYDVGSAFQATITIYTPNSDAGMDVRIIQSAAGYKIVYAPFVNRVATVTIPLYKGVNTFSIRENNVAPGRNPLSRSFWIITKGGKPAPISVWEVTDDLGNTLSGDEWSYYRAPGASKISIYGSVSDMAVDWIDVMVSNEFGPFTRTTVTTSQSGDNTFDTAALVPPDIEIYNGNNYLTLYRYISGSTPSRYRTRLNVWTDAGSVWVPPIKINSVTATGSTITKTADFSTSSDWNATLGPAANYTVTVSGTFKTVANGRYYVSSEGGYESATIAPDGAGNFSFPALLYNGWNYISINDVSSNWYGVNIYTTTGKPVIKPEIKFIDSNPYNATTSGGKYADTNCSATIEGTSEPGSMWVNWTGTIGTSSYYESQNISNTAGTFRFSVPLVGPGGSNIVDINDFKGRWTSVNITTTGSCPYSAPTFNIVTMTTSTGAVVAPSGGSYYSGTTSTVNVTGTSNRLGAQMRVRNWMCGQEETFTAFTSATDGSWTVPNIKVYGQAGGGYWNSLNFEMSNQYQYKDVYSQNTLSPTLRMGITSVTGNSGGVTLTTPYCGYGYWDAGASNTLITTTGTSSVQNGTMTFRDTLNRTGTVPIVNGAFTIRDIPVYQGSDNYVSIYNFDDPAGYSSYSLYITSGNGIPKPRFVQITSPGHGATGIYGSTVVSGTISDPIGSGYSGSNGQIYAQVHDCGAWKYYTNDTWMQTNYGYGAATMSANAFSFTHNFCGTPAAPEPASIYVDIYDYNSSSSHYHQVYYNYGTPPGEQWSKPGVRRPPVDERQRMLDAEAARKAVSVMPK